MFDSTRLLQLGAGNVAVINVGDSTAPLSAWVDLPNDIAAPYDLAFFETPQTVAQHCILGRIGGSIVLVDASIEEGKAALVEQLAALGVQPDDVQHVVITHAHWDHFNRTTVERDGHDVSVFPNAIYHVGRGDWDAPGIQKELASPTSLESRTLGVLRGRGQIDLAEGDRELAPGIRIIATPGETPGHQIVRFSNGGQTLYALGDLYHHVVEAARPHWMVRWANPETIMASRQTLVEAALVEDALLVATHIPTIGRLRPEGTGVVWETVKT